jgi:periplasmic glucans biosynthesis protein
LPVPRRDILRGSTCLLLVTLALPERTARAADRPGGAAFDAATVRNLARELASKPYKASSAALPDAFAKLTYDQYRAIRFDPGQALWRGKGLPFAVQFFHRGFIYKDRVDIYEVSDGKAEPIHYNPDLFSFGDGRPPAGDDIGFAGFRLHAPFNGSDYFDEVCAFLGASYFRAVGKNQIYGLSARGLAVKTADPGGEEFPVFKTFWIERPQPRVASIVVHALLDGPSAAASFRFTIRPGDETLFDVESTIYPRADIDKVGLAPMSSMYYFGPNDHARIDDYRSAVHDSDGLMMWTGSNEQLWRPLTNPVDLQISSFSDVNPRGFGLMQRRHDYAAYRDLEAHYERRPSLWVEPIGNAGDGAVLLVEIPTNREIHDNIAAFWRPTQVLRAKGEYNFNYRLHWCWDKPSDNDLAKAVETRSGAGPQEGSRLFVIEFVSDKLKAMPGHAKLRAEVKADHGKINNVVAQPNPENGGWRVSFELASGGAHVVELRAQLIDNDAPVSEAWVYRWTS